MSTCDDTLNVTRRQKLNVNVATHVECIWRQYIEANTCDERWGAGVETQKNVRGEVGGWGRVPFNEPYAPSLSTIYDGA